MIRSKKRKARSGLRLMAEVGGAIGLFYTVSSFLTWAFSGFVTTTTAFVSAPELSPTTLIDFNRLGDYLRSFGFFYRFLIFCLSELANAYFFGRIFIYLNNKYKATITHLLWFILVIFSSAFVSMLFLRTIVLKGEVSAIKIAFYCVFYLGSLVCTMVFFYRETLTDTTDARDIVERILGIVGGLVGNWSFWGLLFAYFMLSVTVLLDHYWDIF